MKRTLFILLTMISMTLISSCTHNNGDIGPWFGQWKLSELKIDGVADPAYKGDVFWSFQTNIFMMKEMLTDGTGQWADMRWGSWEESDGELLLIFTFSSDHTPPGQGSYHPLPGMYLPTNQVSHLKILKYPGSKMELSYTTPEGKQITYYLERW
ncbi:MAG: lipocalin-like domain-containing protein [Muribaculaceae bacterium]|nr:lipocalin-like domain-containing protein [Muribaculaceae bacterium]